MQGVCNANGFVTQYEVCLNVRIIFIYRIKICRFFIIISFIALGEADQQIEKRMRQTTYQKQIF